MGSPFESAHLNTGTAEYSNDGAQYHGIEYIPPYAGSNNLRPGTTGEIDPLTRKPLTPLGGRPDVQQMPAGQGNLNNGMGLDQGPGIGNPSLQDSPIYPNAQATSQPQPIEYKVQHKGNDMGIIKTGVAGGAGAWLMRKPVPDLLDRAARSVLKTGENTLGTKLLGEQSAAAKYLPQWSQRLAQGEKMINGLMTEEGALGKASKWWQANRHAAAAAESTAATTAAAETTVVGEAAKNGAKAFSAQKLLGEGRLGSLSKMTSSEALAEGKQFFSRPGVQAFLKGAGIAAGTLVADKILPGPKDDYHLSSVGIPVALVAPGDTKTKLMIAGGSLIAGKIANAVLPASEHEHLAEIMRPGFTDTALTTGALFLPLNGRMKAYAAVGAWGMGRMGRMNTVESGITSAGLGLATWKLTHNAPLSATVFVGSWLGSRALNAFNL